MGCAVAAIAFSPFVLCVPADGRPVAGRARTAQQGAAAAQVAEAVETGESDSLSGEGESVRSDSEGDGSAEETRPRGTVHAAAALLYRYAFVRGRAQKGLMWSHSAAGR